MSAGRTRQEREELGRDIKDLLVEKLADAKRRGGFVALSHDAALRAITEITRLRAQLKRLGAS